MAIQNKILAHPFASSTSSITADFHVLQLVYVVHSTEIPSLQIHTNAKQTVVTTYSHRHVRSGFLCLKKPPSVGLQQRIPPAIYDAALAYALIFKGEKTMDEWIVVVDNPFSGQVS